MATHQGGYRHGWISEVYYEEDEVMVYWDSDKFEDSRIAMHDVQKAAMLPAVVFLDLSLHTSRIANSLNAWNARHMHGSLACYHADRVLTNKPEVGFHIVVVEEVRNRTLYERYKRAREQINAPCWL